MTKKLKNLIVNRIDLVDAGANQGAHIVLFKRNDLAKRVREFEGRAEASERRADELERLADEAEERLRQTLAQRTPGRPRVPVTIVAKRAQSLGVTQETVAKRAGISRSYVELVEKGLIPTPSLMTRIADALGSTPEQLWPASHDWESWFRKHKLPFEQPPPLSEDEPVAEGGAEDPYDDFRAQALSLAGCTRDEPVTAADEARAVAAFLETDGGRAAYTKYKQRQATRR
jgi:transcriptional regulator with XRE-family HTH domain